MSATNDDVAAIQRCQQGDIQGLEMLAQRYQSAALRLAYLLIGDADQAQDIVQDSFIHAYQHIHQFHNDQPFSPWFHRIVVNMAHQYLRAPRQRRESSLQSRQDTLEDYPVLDPSSSPDIVAERQEIHTAMLAALDVLPLKQREAIILRYYFGYTAQEIAALLSAPDGTIRRRLHTGRKTLEAIIRQRYPWLISDRWSLDDAPTSLAEGV